MPYHATGLLGFIRRVKSKTLTNAGPMVVHCRSVCPGTDHSVSYTFVSTLSYHSLLVPVCPNRELTLLWNEKQQFWRLDLCTTVNHIQHQKERKKNPPEEYLNIIPSDMSDICLSVLLLVKSFFSFQVPLLFKGSVEQYKNIIHCYL